MVTDYKELLLSDLFDLSYKRRLIIAALNRPVDNGFYFFLCAHLSKIIVLFHEPACQLITGPIPHTRAHTLTHTLVNITQVAKVSEDVKHCRPLFHTSSSYPTNLLSLVLSERSSGWHAAYPVICRTLKSSKWKVFQSLRGLLSDFVVVIWSSWENRPQSHTAPLLQLRALGDLWEDFSAAARLQILSKVVLSQ